MVKDCPDGKILNPVSKRCVLLSGKIGKKIAQENKKLEQKKLAQEKLARKKEAERIELEAKNKNCPQDKIYNPKSKRCVKKNGAIGKYLMKLQILKNKPEEGSKVNPVQHINVKNLKVIKKIGEGGFGITTLVEDTKTHKRYIRKQSRKGYDSDMRYQFDMLLYLKKHNLCKEYFICPVGKYKTDNYYILFDYLDGYITLDDAESTEIFSEKIKMSKQLLHMVQKLHKHNIAHTDLKGNNIMVDPKTKKVRIIDFGTAIINTGKTSYKSKRGFNQYVIAPKFKINGYETFDRIKKNDMWALGNAIWLFLYDDRPNLKTSSNRKKSNELLQFRLNTKQTFFYNELA
jgi:serine/threonine protein kinase